MRVINWLLCVVLSLAFACGNTRYICAQPNLQTANVEERFAKFLTDYRPKSQKLYTHLYTDVVCQATLASYTPYGSEPLIPVRSQVHTASYRADSRQFIRETKYAYGSIDINILRPEVNYALLGEQGKPMRITHKADIPDYDRDNISSIERWKLDSGDYHGIGLGLIYRNEPVLTILTKKGVVITDVLSHKDGVLDTTTIYLHFPPSKDKHELSFHTDIGVCFKQVCRREKVLGVTVLEYDCPGRSLDLFVPKRRTIQDEIIALKLPPRMVEELTVEEFRKQSRFDDSVFRLEQFGLPDFIASPPRTGWRSRILIALGGACGLITLVVLWRLGRRRTAAQS